MKRALLLLLPLALCGLACYAQSKPETSSAEALDPQQILFDFGRVKAPAVVTHTFELKNESSKELRIKDVTTSCGCTGSQIKKKKLAPGESTQLTVTFRSQGYTGEVTQFVYAYTDNFGQPAGMVVSPALRVDGKPVRPLDITLLRFIIRSEVEP